MKRVLRIRPGDEVPDDAVFLCVHAVAEKVWEPVTGADAAYHMEGGRRVEDPTRRLVVRDVPYVWYEVTVSEYPMVEFVNAVQDAVRDVEGRVDDPRGLLRQRFLGMIMQAEARYREATS